MESKQIGYKVRCRLQRLSFYRFLIAMSPFWLGDPAAAQSLPAGLAAVVESKCASCHGSENPAAGLRLSGAIAEHPKAKEIARQAYARVSTSDRALRMPPTGRALAPEEIALFAAWSGSATPGTGAETETAAQVSGRVVTGVSAEKSFRTVDFTTDVAPILKAACVGCHGATSPKAQLRLDVPAGLVKGGLGGPIFVSGQPDQSRLIHRVEGKGNERQMPLGAPALANDQVAILRAWIAQGAKLPESSLSQNGLVEKHWAYRKPSKVWQPAAEASAAIDHFVKTRLEKEGLALSPTAPKSVLARRAALDLTGLPPTPEQLREFLSDTSPTAYATYVEKLLASPHYGERWARHWLDLARYADSNGFEKDNRRVMWKYRDWVIQAFNRDLPFDQFTVEQLAGDLLPNPDTNQRIATGFHRNTMWNEEGGVDKDEVQFEILVDRVNTTATVWLASTMGCSQCHNHKYDPFLHKEYYQMMAFFSNGQKKEVPHGVTTKYEEPILDLASPDQEAQRSKLQARLKEVESALKTTTPALAESQRRWEATLRNAAAQWKPLQQVTATATGGAQLRAQANGALLADGPNPAQTTYEITGVAESGPLRGLRLEALPAAGLPRGGPGRDVYGNFLLSRATLEVKRGNKWEAVSFSRIVSDNGRTSDGRGPDEKGRPMWLVDAASEEVRLARQLVLVPEKPVKIGDKSELRIRLEHAGEFPGLALGHFRITTTQADDPTLVVKPRHTVRPIWEKAESERSKDEAAKLAEVFRALAPELDGLRDEAKQLRNAMERLQIPTALVVAEAAGDEPPSDYVRTRGGFASKAEKVYAGVPAALGSLQPGDPQNRLGLARWLVSRENPLTARVAVNRIWEQYFGRGIVETSEDFGSQGAAPTHPELLDWLAVDFMEKGWSLKRLHRAIVLSETYQQSSKTNEQLLSKDPYNRLLSRGPRFRMEAEMIRDAGLAASGLLSRKVGGPSVFPPQPPNVWDIPYSDEKWVESSGEDKFRRALYTFARRSAMYPAMMNFDATSREFCTVRRIRTNTPLQALTTLNDRAFFEMAQALAARVMKEAGKNERERLNLAYQYVLGRAPQPMEVDRVMTWLAQERKYFQGHREEARKLAPPVSTGADAAEGAALTMLANVMLNLDEALTKE